MAEINYLDSLPEGVLAVRKGATAQELLEASACFSECGTEIIAKLTMEGFEEIDPKATQRLMFGALYLSEIAQGLVTAATTQVIKGASA